MAQVTSGSGARHKAETATARDPFALERIKNMSDEEFADTMSKNAMDMMSRAHKKIKSQEFEKELGINNQPATQEELKDLKSLIEGDLSPVERRWW